MARKKDYGRSRERERDRYGEPYEYERERRRARERFGEAPHGADYENSMYFPDAEPRRSERHRGMEDEYDRWNRERAMGDYYGSGYGYSGQRPYRSHGGPSSERHERGFVDRARDEVASWSGDDEAERRREMDQYRGKGPKGYTRPDSRILEDVSDRLTDDGALDASNIEVSVLKGEVQLSGFVDSKWAKRRAEDCADDVSGVTHVQNNLRVQPPTGPAVQAHG
ncbi:MULTISPECIES: BON domain-containing protein [unclassified Sinorhizobium]|uniref:BON domain-containing protein n=1 Tax=unclassified Sinorhizobium TaxID=2613772 RepID=UPI0024C39FCD|nr:MULTISPECIES: BON domain-containing protein [unclassified Sinorhizobium]MDK1374373.1 BON domain-containing protein [Sinorhizobium sp. 6-70]MDK1478974.1 BON domain-containing protein [Sinorhizobium sp. 6-117]